MSNTNNSKISDIAIILQKPEYQKLINIISDVAIYTITYYLSRKAFNSFSINKISKPKNLKKIVIPLEIKKQYDEVSINIDKDTPGFYKATIVNFIEKIEQVFPKEYLTIFINNINELNFKNSNFLLSNIIGAGTAISVGEYGVKNNKIKVANYKSELPLYHELFHMASSVYKNGVRYSGFRIVPKNIFNSIGVGINEGYTELLTERYFGSDYFLSKGYKYLKGISERLEEIVGKEKMEYYYLTANLKGLIDELSKYTDLSMISKFISDTDCIIQLMDSNLTKSTESQLQKVIISANEFLLYCYIKKVKSEIDSTEQLSEIINNYKNSFGDVIKISNKEYNLLDYNSLHNVLGLIFNYDEENNKKM